MKTLFLTGGNRGLGLATLKRFAENGFNIIVSTRQQYSEFEDTCRSLEKKNGIQIYHLYIDFSDSESITEGMREFSKLGMTPTVLVNNASMPYDKTLLMSKLSDIRTCFQVNYFAAVQITQYIAKKMLRTGGSIINISSVSSLTRQSAGTGYSASKAAINVFTASLAQELAPFKIRVNAIAPGGMNTDMFEATNESNKKVLIGNTAMKRIGLPEEIADTVFYLASDNSSYITGQVIRVDGGLIL